MFGIHNYWLFILSGLLLNMLPGQDTLYILGKSVSQGRRAGTNVLNPKVAIFFLAFLPQFIDVHSGSKVLPFIILGLTFVFNGTLWCMIVAWFASAFSQRFRERSSTGSWLKRAAGALFMGLGLKLAIEKL